MSGFFYNNYQESNIKQSRRKSILENTLIFALDKGINNISFKDISDYLKIERRTLYDYYKSKDELVLDLTYIAAKKITDKNLEIFEIFDIAYKDERAKDILKLILESISVIVCVKCYDLSKFLTDVNLMFYNVDKTSEAYLKYKGLLEEFTIKNQFIDSIVTRLIEEENIKKYTIEELIEILRQSFYSYLIQALINSNKEIECSISNIKIFIDLLVNGMINS